MMYPLVRELAGDGIPVTVTCRVLKIARQPYYRWLVCAVTDAELEQAYRANALFDAHRDDPEFGYRFLVDEARESGVPMAERTGWRICSDNGWWSAFGKKKARGKGKKVGPPVHDDLVKRDFTADAPNQLWLGDITEHWTACIPAVVATVGYPASIRAVRRSVGVSQSRDRRGRPLSSSATVCSWSGSWTRRSVPLGKYWRRSPLVFSLLPRCQGEPGSQK